MPRLDVSTLLLMAALVEVGFAAIMAYVYFAEKTYPGFRDWALATVLQAFGLVLITTRVSVPLAISAIFAGALLLASADRILRGVHRFAGGSARPSVDEIVVIVSAMAGMTYFLYINPWIEARIAAFSIGIAYPTVKSAYFCAVRMPAAYRNDGRILAVALIAIASDNLMRGAIAWWFALVPGVDLLNRGNSEALLLAIGPALMVPVMIMFLVLNGKRSQVELEAAYAQVRRLEGIIPICMYCKKIRNDRQSWQAIEQYLTEHSSAMLSHGVCPDCVHHMDVG